MLISRKSQTVSIHYVTSFSWLDPATFNFWLWVVVSPPMHPSFPLTSICHTVTSNLKKT